MDFRDQYIIITVTELVFEHVGSSDKTYRHSPEKYLLNLALIQPEDQVLANKKFGFEDGAKMSQSQCNQSN